MNLPPIAKKEHLTCHWFYRNTNKDAIALVTRHDNLSSGQSKKWFHQYQLDSNGNWVEGAATPSPLFGIDTLPKSHCDQKIYIFEGEKCTQAAHHLDLPAITSMRGANQSHLADWAILAQHRHLKDFVLIPDNDVAGRQYIETAYKELQKACPHANIWICKLPSNHKGADLVDWIQSNSNSMPKWNGFEPIDNPYSQYLKQALESHVEENRVIAEKFFSDLHEPCFESDPEPIQELLSAVLPCPIDTLPAEVNSWIASLTDQMQIEPDYIAAALVVQIGSLIGRKRALKLRKGTNWIEFPNMWGMLIGRPSTLKSVAMQETIKPLNGLASEATAEYKKTLKQFQKELGAWEIQKKVAAEKYKDICKESNTTTAATYSISDPPDKPKHRRYKSDDPTVEKLGILLYENPQGLLLYRDELAGWLYNLQKKGKENDRQFYLESWNAKQSFDVDRISRDSLHIDALCLSILGGIQPGPLSQYIHSV
jgi:DNA primase